MSAVYSNTLARINSGQLLTADKYRRLADADYLSALKILADYGYGGGAAASDIDTVITRETDALIQFIEEECVNRHAARTLLCRFVYSNAKALYKSRFVAVDLSAALYGVSVDLDGIKDGDYEELSVYMADALTQLDQETDAPNPRRIDAVLTRARFTEELAEAKKSHSRTLVKYVVSEIDLNNILTTFRINALSLSKATLAEMYIEGGTVDRDTLFACVGADTAFIAEQLERTPYGQLVNRLCEKGYGYLADFETGSDDYLYMLTDQGVTSLDKFDVFLRYVLAQLTEFKMVKMILTCIKNGVREEIPKRMRCLDE